MLSDVGLVRLFMQGQWCTCYASIVHQTWCSLRDPRGQQLPQRGTVGLGGALYETEVVGIQAGNISQRSRDTPEVAV